MDAGHLLSLQATVRDRRLVTQQRLLARFMAARLRTAPAGLVPVIVEVGIGQGGQTFPDLLFCFESAGIRRARFVLVEYSPPHLEMARDIVPRVLETYPLRPGVSFQTSFLPGDMFARPGQPLAVADALMDAGLGRADLIHTSNVLTESASRRAALAALGPAGRDCAVLALGTAWRRPDGEALVGHTFWATANIKTSGPTAGPFACVPFTDRSHHQHDAGLWEAFERASGESRRRTVPGPPHNPT